MPTDAERRATAAAEQRIAELEAEVERLKERNADQYKALKKKWKDDWRAHNPDEAKAHDIIKRAAALLQSDRERAEAAEKERDALRAELNAEGREWLRTKDIDRLQAAEARLARAREALERIAGSRAHDMNTLHPEGCAHVAAEALHDLAGLDPDQVQT